MGGNPKMISNICLIVAAPMIVASIDLHIISRKKNIFIRFPTNEIK